MAKEIIQEHEDVLGQPIKIGSYVAVAWGTNSLHIASVTKITPKKFRITSLNKSKYNFEDVLVYPSQVVVLSGPDALVYILKNAGPK